MIHRIFTDVLRSWSKHYDHLTNLFLVAIQNKVCKPIRINSAYLFLLILRPITFITQHGVNTYDCTKRSAFSRTFRSLHSFARCSVRGIFCSKMSIWLFLNTVILFLVLLSTLESA